MNQLHFKVPKMKQYKSNGEGIKAVKEAESLTRQLVFNYVRENGRDDFFNQPNSKTVHSDDILRRLEARLEMESKFSHQGNERSECIMSHSNSVESFSPYLSYF